MIRKTLTLILACGGVVATFVACSSSDAEDKYPSSDSFCAAKAAAECKNLAVANCGADETRCTSIRTDACKAAAVAAQSAGRNYKASAAEACINKVNAVYSPKIIDPEKELELVDTCERVFGGTKAANTPCASSYECDGAQVCDKTVCAAKVDTAVGAACANPGQVCAKGSFCAAQGQNKFCVAKKAENEICTPDSPCKEDLRCVGAGAGGGSCKPRVTAGNACDTDNDCVSTAPACDATKKCGLKYQPTSKACKDFGAL